MDIELRLREMLVLRDPGPRFTENVLSRLGDALPAQSSEGVARLADAQRRKRGRRLLVSALAGALAAAAAMLPFIRDQFGEKAAAQVATVVDSGDETSIEEADASLPSTEAGGSGGGVAPLDCLDEDVLQGLLLPAGQTGFRVVSSLPPELKSLRPSSDLVWLGTAERSTPMGPQVSTAYHTTLAPGAAREVAATALADDGWTRRGAFPAVTRAFVSSPSSPAAEIFCRNGVGLSLTSGDLSGVTYVVLSPQQGNNMACGQPAREVPRTTASLDDELPTLHLPVDPRTGRSAPLQAGSHGRAEGPGRRESVTFTTTDAVDGVAAHFAAQMAGQGWQADTRWTGNRTAGSTWTRRLDEGRVLVATIDISAFDDGVFSASLTTIVTE